MTLEINHMDTLLLVKSILDLVHDTVSVECYEGIEDMLKQMRSVPETDDKGFFIKGSPRDLAIRKLHTVSCYDQIEEYLDKDTDVKHAYISLESNIGEAMGPVAYAAWKLKWAIMVSQYSQYIGTDWIDDFLKWYENTSFVKG